MTHKSSLNPTGLHQRMLILKPEESPARPAIRRLHSPPDKAFPLLPLPLSLSLLLNLPSPPSQGPPPSRLPSPSPLPRKASDDRKQ